MPTDHKLHQSPRRFDIQGLRGLAVALVVAYHAASEWLPAGFVGVDVFFVISGWVITHSVLSRWEATGTFSVQQFWARRALRLIPALSVMIMISAALGSLVLAVGPTINSLQTGLLALVSLGNVAAHQFTGDYFSLDAELNFQIHTWSLSVEEQYYLGFSIAILAIVLFGAKKRLPSALLISSILVFALSFLSAWIGHLDVVDGAIADAALGFYSPLPRLWEFLCGVIAYLLTRQPKRLSSFLSSLSFGTGLGLIVLSSTGSISWGIAPFATEVFAAVTGSVLVLTSGKTVLKKITLESKPLIWLGDRSYSIYLWHWPLIVFANQTFGNSILASSWGLPCQFPLLWPRFGTSSNGCSGARF